MTFLGPRVYAAMARDGFLPRILQGKEGKPPIGAVVLQGAIALFLVFAYQLGEVLNNVGAILTLFSALTVFSLFWIRFRKNNQDKAGIHRPGGRLFLSDPVRSDAVLRIQEIANAESLGRSKHPDGSDRIFCYQEKS